MLIFIWMIKCLKRYFKADPTGDLSVRACVARADFVNLLAACDFEARTAQCSRDPVTTTTPKSFIGQEFYWPMLKRWGLS
jgi:hypothetical protein